MSPVMSNVLLMFAAFSGMPIFAAMIILQFLITMIVILILVGMKASENVVALVAAFAFLAMGYAIVVTPAGVVTLVIEHILAIGAFAVHRGYALQSPVHIEAISIGDYGQKVHLGVKSGTYFGPAERVPDHGKLLDGTASVAEKMTGNSRPSRAIVEAPTVYYEDPS